MKTEHYYRQLDQEFERTVAYEGDRLPYYFRQGVDGQWCSYCDGPVAKHHPTEALDVCPAYERYLADVTP